LGPSAPSVSRSTIGRIRDDSVGLWAPGARCAPQRRAQQLPRNGHYDPIEGGIEIGNTSLTVLGTLGVLVFDADSPVAMGLSCHHVQ